MRDATITDTGCYLDNHRGHYITRDAIMLAQSFGFIVGPFEEWAVSTYESVKLGDIGDAEYPFEALVELCDEAVAWLNSGQVDCPACLGSGIPREDGEAFRDKNDNWRCRPCSGTGRGDRIKGQNFPPRVPEGFTWAFEDGDFGLYKYDDDGNVTE